MALPYPTKVVLPFDIATAQDMNERHANDVALAAGTGLDDGSITADKIDFATFPVQYGGGVNFTSGLPKTFTPAHDGVMYVTAHSRRNSGTAGDNVITISVTGASGSIAGGAVGNGTADGFAKADWIGAVTKGTPVTISISATNNANPGWKFFVIPGAPQVE